MLRPIAPRMHEARGAARPRRDRRFVVDRPEEDDRIGDAPLAGELLERGPHRAVSDEGEPRRDAAPHDRERLDRAFGPLLRLEAGEIQKDRILAEPMLGSERGESIGIASPWRGGCGDRILIDRVGRDEESFGREARRSKSLPAVGPVEQEGVRGGDGAAPPKIAEPGMVRSEAMSPEHGAGSVTTCDSQGSPEIERSGVPTEDQDVGPPLGGVDRGGLPEERPEPSRRRGLDAEASIGGDALQRGRIGLRVRPDGQVDAGRGGEPPKDRQPVGGHERLDEVDREAHRFVVEIGRP